jgi:hypothetical protein
VAPNLLAIEIDIRKIISGSKINKEARIALSLIIEGFFVPDSAFVKQ